MCVDHLPCVMDGDVFTVDTGRQSRVIITVEGRKNGEGFCRWRMRLPRVRNSLTRVEQRDFSECHF